MPCIYIYFGIVAIHLYVHKNMFCVVYVPTVLRFRSFLSVFVSSSDSRSIKVIFLFLQRTRKFKCEIRQNIFKS